MPRETSIFADAGTPHKWAGGGRAALAEWRSRHAGMRGILLYILSAPLALAALTALVSGNLQEMIASAAAFGMIVAGARYNRKGLVERIVAPERRYTKATRLPYQYLAMFLTATGTLLAAYAVVDHGVAMSVAYGVTAAAGFHLAYALPPINLPQIRLAKSASDPTTRHALEQAENQLLAIEKAAYGMGNSELEQRLHHIAAKGRSILDLLAERPTALFQARRFLNVHLDGAERVASRFVKAHRLVRGGILESKFRNVLAQIESAFERQHRDLLANDLSDLDIHIEVLRKQLEREGIA